MTKTIQHFQQDIYQLSEKYHIKNPRLFGSIVTDNYHDNSDIDVLVDSTENTTLFDIGGFQQALCELLGREVDVVTAEDLSETFREQVLSSAIPV